MEIRILGPEDIHEMNLLFSESFRADGAAFSLSQSKIMAVAVKDGKPVGAGGIFVNPVHQNVPKISIAVRPEHRRSGIGRRIHEFLISSERMTSSVCDGGCFSDDDRATSFMRALGYTEILDCEIATIDLKSPCELRSSRNVKRIAQLLDTEITRNDLLKFLVAHYSETHFWNPVTLSVEDSKWDDLAFRGVDFNLGAALVEAGRLMGASTASRGAKDELRIVWTFASGSTEEQGSTIENLLFAQFRWARENGMSHATLEMDSTDCGLMSVKNKLSIAVSQRWRRFRLKI